MTGRKTTLAAAMIVLASGIAAYCYQRWNAGGETARGGMLAMMPDETGVVFYADIAELRRSPFAQQLFKWAPQPQVDPEYAVFLRDTGFNYERDLDRLAVAVMKHGPESSFFGVADGKFERKKIEEYASHSGTHENRSGRELFTVPLTGSTQKIWFSFLRKDRIVLTNDSVLAAQDGDNKPSADTEEWRRRFERLAGSPIFAVIRQDAGAGTALASQAPGGLQSPQLSVLLDQLQWITVAGKPEGDQLRIVAEGEAAAEGTTRQLADVLNGVLVLAQAGLNGLQTRQQLDPKAREAYLSMLRSANVSRIDRGDTKSVRLVFDLSPKFLEAARTELPKAAPAAASPAAPAGQHVKAPAKKTKAGK